MFLFKIFHYYNVKAISYQLFSVWGRTRGFTADEIKLIVNFRRLSLILMVLFPLHTVLPTAWIQIASQEPCTLWR